MVMVGRLLWVMQALRTWTSRLGAHPPFFRPTPETTRWASVRDTRQTELGYGGTVRVVRIDLLHYRSLVEKWTAGRDGECRLAVQRGIAHSRGH